MRHQREQVYSRLANSLFSFFFCVSGVPFFSYSWKTPPEGRQAVLIPDRMRWRWKTLFPPRSLDRPPSAGWPEAQPSPLRFRAACFLLPPFFPLPFPPARTGKPVFSFCVHQWYLSFFVFFYLSFPPLPPDAASSVAPFHPQANSLLGMEESGDLPTLLSSFPFFSSLYSAGRCLFPPIL